MWVLFYPVATRLTGFLVHGYLRLRLARNWFAESGRLGDRRTASKPFCVTLSIAPAPVRPRAVSCISVSKRDFFIWHPWLVALRPAVATRPQTSQTPHRQSARAAGQPR